MSVETSSSVNMYGVTLSFVLPSSPGGSEGMPGSIALEKSATLLASS